MKFLVIHRPNNPGSHELLERKADKVAAMLREWIDSGVVEQVYVLVGGGHMYICEARDDEELTAKVRYDPLFTNSNTEVIPIVDGLAFLERYARPAGEAAAEAS